MRTYEAGVLFPSTRNSGDVDIGAENASVISFFFLVLFTRCKAFPHKGVNAVKALHGA